MTGYSLKQERYYVFVLALIQFIHLVDFVIMMPLGPRFIQEFSISPTQFASMVSSYNIAAGIAAILIGGFSDKFDRKRLMVICFAGLAFGTFLCGYANSFSTLLMARIFAGSFGGMVNALILAIVADIIPFERRGRAMGVITSSFSIASVAGVPLGLMLADLYGWKFCFYAIAVFMLLINVVVMTTFPHLRDFAGGVGGFAAIRRYGQFLSNGDYRLSFLYIFLVAMSMFVVIPFLAPYAVKNMHIAVEHIKYMYLVGGLATIITARVFGLMTDSWGPFRTFTLVAFISVWPVLLYTNAGPMTLIPYLAMGTFFMTMVSGRMIPCMTLMTAVPKPMERGGYMGVVNSLRAFGSATSTFIGGLLITETAGGSLKGFSRAGHLSIAIILVTCILGYFLAKKTGLYRPFFSRKTNQAL